jgi:hypothetical protein
MKCYDALCEEQDGNARFYYDPSELVQLTIIKSEVVERHKGRMSSPFPIARHHSLNLQSDE